MNIQQLLTDADAKLGIMDRALAAATAALAVGDLSTTQANITRAHMTLAGASMGLARVAMAAAGRMQQPDNMVVVDVGAADDPAYTGSLVWQQLTHEDWAFYFKNGLEARQALIFSAKPQYINPNTGAHYNNRDAEFRNPDGTYMDLSNYNGPLKGFANG